MPASSESSPVATSSKQPGAGPEVDASNLNTRREARIPMALAGKVVLCDDTGGQVVLPIEILDRSRRGLRFLTTTRLMAGAMGKLLTDSGDVASGRCKEFEVRWVKPVGGGQFEIGAKVFYLVRGEPAAKANGGAG